ncbi:hypothetical protein NSZ01_24200 [Nocardioides szechwanensis]|uniref:DnaJ homologue subfamily C member 28 conserved domain-containing protein n=2 Tax=Nocardioides szechwanensis TaxID=1005944 RepID=A0A1H0EJI1_9ACTN|nr:hypothetical protein NSZ01_24200 [Nocardioides szechwanensis]SDN82637.1 protein of unknown function [Nocardioides szechwanensis]
MTMSDQPEQEKPDRSRVQDDRTGRSAAAARMAQQASWVDQQIRVAMAKGEFDDLPGAGKPLKDLGSSHDPDWWLKKLVERERIAVLPPSLQLRKDDAELDARLDQLFADAEVRREVEDFNARVMRARYSPQDGQPPLITMPRDLDETVAAWQQRRADRRTARAAEAAPDPAPPRRRWWQRRR